MILGTTGYMSPEQVRGGPVDHRTDLFSFGAVLFEMLSGRQAFTGESPVEVMNAILTQEPPDLAEINVQVPRPLELITRKCLEKEPRARFQSASDIAFALQALSESRISSASVPKPAARRPRHWWLAATGLLILILLSTVLVTIRRAPSPIGANVQPADLWAGDSELGAVWPGWANRGLWRHFRRASPRLAEAPGGA